ncbi:peptidoglycan-binding protein [Anabaena sp. CCY 0017]|uniref:peptidoglycan-binding protein n=1 Tax=Anabaena sp. CCY 0017 TaxID=3103866 RepID=UPI0039C644D2
MRRCFSSILIFTCFTCWGFLPHRASIAADNITLKTAQTSSTNPVQAVIEPGGQGTYVQVMQIQLKELGLYNGVIDGIYGPNTQNAVREFQKSQNLAKTDGVVDLETRRSLQTAWTKINPLAVTAPCTSPTVPETEQQAQSSQRGLIWWSLLGLGILGSIGALLFLVKWFRQIKDQPESTTTAFKALSPGKEDLVNQALPELEQVSEPQENHVSIISPQTDTASISTTVIPLEMIPHLNKLSISEKLIHDLRGSDRTKRCKAIWGLGQQGDSRAIQPLVDLMIHVDSQQRSLILAALAEINSRALTPMNRALAISLQDESPQVRQNAIRDLSRVYDMMIQMTQMLVHALEDPDIDVQTTAKYALTQIDKIRVLTNQQSLLGDHHQEA